MWRGGGVVVGVAVAAAAVTVAERGSQRGG